jgi:hypothetical protein
MEEAPTVIDRRYSFRRCSLLWEHRRDVDAEAPLLTGHGRLRVILQGRSFLYTSPKHFADTVNVFLQ